MKFTLNLASRRYINQRALNHGFLTALCLLLLVCAWGIYGMVNQNALLQQSLRQVAELRSQLDELRGGPVKPLNAEDRKSLEAEFEVAGDLLAQDAFRWTALLDRMEKLLPSGVSLNSFHPDFDKDSLSIGGRAQSLKKMRRFLDRLMKDGGFDQVYLKAHSRTKVKDYAGEDQPAISFSISLQGVF